MMIKLSDSEWVAASEIRRLFLQTFTDNAGTVHKLAADLGNKIIYGAAYKDFYEATKILDWLTKTISEATRHEK